MYQKNDFKKCNYTKKIVIFRKISIVFFSIILLLSLLSDNVYGDILVVYSKENCSNGSMYFNKISDAVANAKPNDIVVVCPGKYSEQITITKPLTIRGFSKANSNILYRSGWNYLIKINSDNVTLENLTIISDEPYSILWASAIEISGRNITVSNIQILAPFENGIVINYSNNVKISNIFTRKVGNQGKTLYIANSDNIYVEDSSIFVNDSERVIFLENTSSSRIINNYIISMSSGETNIGAFGIYLSSGSSGNEIANNIIYKGLDTCLYVADASSSNNLIYNNYFDCFIPASDQNAVNNWNTTKIANKNIIGGSFVCGNYWSGQLGYSGADTNGDNLGDTDIPYKAYSEEGIPYITNGGDYCPLILVEDSSPPIFTYINPTPKHGSSVTTSVVTINLSVKYFNLNYTIDSCILVFNGKMYEMNITNISRNKFYCSREQIPELGYNEFYVIIKNTNNETMKSERRGFYYTDIEPPKIRVESPKSDVFARNYVFINITSNENLSKALLKFNGIILEMNNYTRMNWYYNLTNLSDGFYNITVNCSDVAGNWNWTNIVFTVDTKPPEIVVNNPKNNSFINSSKVYLNISIQDITETSIVAKINETNITLNFVDGYYIGEKTLDDGFYVLNIYAKDYANNTNNKTVYFKIDTLSPKILILSPQNETYNISEINITVSATENVDVWWYILNDDEKKYFLRNFSLKLIDGFYCIKIYANDTAGNIGYNSTCFTVDTVLYIPKTPKNGTYIDEGWFVINISTADPFTNSWAVIKNINNNFTWNISLSPVNSQKTIWTANITNISEGIYKFIVYGEDINGIIRKSKERYIIRVLIFLENSTVIDKNTTILVKNNNISIEILSLDNVTSNLTVNLSLYISTIPIFVNELNKTTTSEKADRGIKYIRIRNLTIEGAKIKIKVYYDEKELGEVDENTLALYYWNGSLWVNSADYINKSLPNGPFVYEAGRNTKENYVYIVVNGTSYWALGGVLGGKSGYEVQQTTYTSAGGGIGGSKALSKDVLPKTFNELTKSLLEKIFQEKRLINKIFIKIQKQAVASMLSISEKTGMYPFCEDLKNIIKKQPRDLEGNIYEIVSKHVLSKYVHVDYIIVTRGDIEADSYVALSLAREKNAPILLTKPDSLPEETLNTIIKLKPKKIIIVGGPKAVSVEVENELRKHAEVVRIWGETRIETSLEVAKQFASPKYVVIANWNTSEKIAYIAYFYKAPVLYVKGDELPDSVEEYLKMLLEKDPKPKIVFADISDTLKEKIMSLA